MCADKIKVLVTGGAGFLGSHLCEKLVQDGFEVVCLDNFYTGSIENIAHLLKKETFSLIEHDICNPIAMEVDQIYNLACPASPEHYQKDPIFTTRTCVIGSLNMLELARQNRAPILQASTSEVYGDPTVHPQPESYNGHVNPIGPRACYDEGKRCAETLFFDYKRMHGVDIKVARIFNTYGPRMQEDDGRVVSNFIIQSLEDEPITVYGKGEQTRSFCYVDDLITGLVLFMNSKENGPINFGNPDEYTIHELAELILDKMDSDSIVEYAPIPKDDPKRRRPIITAAETKLQWKPEVPLAEGLKKTIAYFS
ncbi:MAG: SDR family oxidoreductase [Simkaniaceae bacterium]|nr:SDR family oxidoreductase [Candidatus Sacchlamyda saccharinae]